MRRCTIILEELLLEGLPSSRNLSSGMEYSAPSEAPLPETVRAHIAACQAKLSENSLSRTRHIAISSYVAAPLGSRNPEHLQPCGSPACNDVLIPFSFGSRSQATTESGWPVVESQVPVPKRTPRKPKRIVGEAAE